VPKDVFDRATGIVTKRGYCTRKREDEVKNKSRQENYLSGDY
jgi:hypothetical protein